MIGVTRNVTLSGAEGHKTQDTRHKTQDTRHKTIREIFCNTTSSPTHHLRQGKGIATTLLAHLEAEARQLDIATLTTDSSLTARPFFLKHGFQLVNENIKTVDGVEFLNSRLSKTIVYETFHPANNTFYTNILPKPNND